MVTDPSHPMDTVADGGAIDEEAAAAAAAILFRGMGEVSRMVILRHLLLGEHNVSELTAHLGLAQSTVSKHLSCLRDCGLVQSRPSGRSSVFSLTQPDAVLKVFATTEELLAATGDAVVLCPTLTDHENERLATQ